ncbi:hypothetical protein BO443_110055 [Burkholderia orbicola]
MVCRTLSSVPASGSAATDAPHASAHAATSRGRPRRAANRDGKGMTVSVASDDSYVAKDKIIATHVKRRIAPTGLPGRAGIRETPEAGILKNGLSRQVPMATLQSIPNLSRQDCSHDYVDPRPPDPPATAPDRPRTRATEARPGQLREDRRGREGRRRHRREG